MGVVGSISTALSSLVFVSLVPSEKEPAWAHFSEQRLVIEPMGVQERITDALKHPWLETEPSMFLTPPPPPS